MQSRKHYIILIFIFLLSFSSCKKFLDVLPSTGNVNPSNLKDFQEMLNNDSLAQSNFLFADLISDDVDISQNILNEHYGNTYLWKEHIWAASEGDQMYTMAYARILQLNIILQKAPNAETNSDAEKKDMEIVIAQAKIHRAWYYLQLSNIYGQDYTSGNSQSDLAVPLIMVPDASEKPARATVKTQYDQIIKDLTEAIATAGLPNMGQTIIHPGRAAALALLSRTYLLMGDYAKALDFANQTLALNSTLMDYNKLTAPIVSLLDQKRNPEILMAKMGVDYNYRSAFQNTFNASTELSDLYDWGDKRLSLYFPFGNSYISMGNAITSNYGIGVPEMMLTKAEALARTGKPQEAVPLLNSLRKNRLNSPSDLVLEDNEVLKAVLDERRRELFLHGGLRLFDLKRLNRDPKLAKRLVRTRFNWDTYSNDTLATLEPNSPRYLMEFAPLIIQNNTKIKQNPR